MMYKRNLAPNILAALSDTPVVLLNGARQTGKSTLTKQLLTTTPYNVPFQPHNQYLTLDDTNILAAARADPDGFIRRLPERVILDEIQHAPELFRSIKLAVDHNRIAGRFLLTGSANVLLLPQLSESLAGRMEILTLWPLSQGELIGKQESFIDIIFNDKIKDLMKTNNAGRNSKSNLITNLIQGGYPEVINRKTEARRKAWFKAYITTILQRDIRDIANIHSLIELSRLLSLLAGRITSLLNYAELSRTMTIPQTTLKRYLTLLEIIFLIFQLPAWANNHGKRLTKSPKIMLNDTGLVSYLLDINSKKLEYDTHLLGKILENYVTVELQKQSAWNNIPVKLYHFRTQDGAEVDLILENLAGEIIGIEVKASSTVTGHDFKGLKILAEIAGKKFKSGLVLYTGENVLPFAANLWAIPVNLIWET